MHSESSSGLDRLFSRKSRIFIVFALLFALTLLIRMSFVGLLPIWREDAFHYLDKAEEILDGDFSLKSQDIGLPLFYAFFLKILGSGDLLSDLPIAQVLLALVEALLLIPLVLIARRFFGWKAALLAGLLFTFWPELIYWTTQGYSEGLFMLFLLLAFLFLIQERRWRVGSLLAAACVGLAYYVRVNGLFFLPVILAYMFLVRKERAGWNGRWLLYMVLIFVLVVSPYFVLRATLYDSPLHYSMAAKFLFLDNDQQLFDPAFNPTLSSYLASHTLGDITARAWRGLSTVIRDTYELSPFLLTLAFLGLLLFRRRKETGFHLVFLFWFLGLFWIYGAVRNSRFVLPLIPLAIILAAAVAVRLFEGKKKELLWLGCVLLGFVFLTSGDFLRMRSGMRWEGRVWKDARVWGQWIRDNIPAGSVLAIREGIDIADFMAPDVELVTIPNREEADEILDYFRDEKVNYVGLGTGGLEIEDWNRIPALREIRKRPRWPFITRVYANQDIKWAMEIYRMDWTKRGKESERGDGDVVEAESLDRSGLSLKDEQASAGFAVVMSPGGDSSFLLGPLVAVPEGRYRITMRMKVEAPEDTDWQIGYSVFIQRLERILHKDVLQKDIFSSGRYIEIEAEVDLDARRDLHFRFNVPSTVRLSIDRLTFSRIPAR
ncbi:MAG: glycosyltransferase family 39 protein [Acidobacteriota bacterium]|nr:glycosyltransferase family 39 protein [Acidobacteriota bacterium]